MSYNIEPLKFNEKHSGLRFVAPVTRLATQVQALARDTVLYSCARHFTLPVPLSAQVYKWVTASLMLGVTLQRTSITSKVRRRGIKTLLSA